MGGNPAHFENVCRPFRYIGCTTLSHVGSQGYYHRYGQILAQSFQGCCVCLVLCSALALFQCTLHAQLSGLVPRYRTKSGVSRLIFPLQASPDRVFSHKEQRWWPEVSFNKVMHIELVIKSDTTRTGLIFADLNFETLFYPVSKQKVLVSERYYVPWQRMKAWQKFYS